MFGHRLINSQLIADQLAANGYFVLMPDLFYGDNMTVDRPADFDVPKWMQGGYSKDGIAHLPPVIDPIIEKCLHELRTAYNAKVSVDWVQSPLRVFWGPGESILFWGHG